MSDVILKQLDVLDAQVELFRVQLQALRHAIGTPVPKATASVAQLARCEGIPDRFCGLVDEDARRDCATFAAPHRWQCAGCGERVGEDAMTVP